MDPTEVKNSIFEQMISGNLSHAEMLEQEHSVTAMDASSIAEKAFDELMKSKKYQLAEHFELSSDRQIDAVNAQFRSLIVNKEFNKAIEWGTKFKMPENEIRTADIKAFKDALDARDVEKAIKFKESFKIPFELIAGEARRWFNIYFENQTNVKALLLGMEFDISRKRTLTAGIRGFLGLLENGKTDTFANLEKKFTILGDRDLTQVDEFKFKKFSKIFIEKIVKEFIAKDQANQLAAFIDTLKLMENRDANAYISALVKETVEEVARLHNGILESGNYNSAYTLVKNFRLLTNVVTADTKVKLIASAEKLHHKLIQDNNLSAAQTVKENYLLFTKNIISNSLETAKNVAYEFLKNTLINGQIDDAKTVIKEYELNGEELTDIINSSIMNQLKSRKFLEVFDIINEMDVKVTSPEIKTEATSKFHDAYENGQMELATNIAFHFKIKEKRVVNAAFIIWQKHIESGRFREALDVKKRLRIPKSRTEAITKEIYGSLIREGQAEQAVIIRKAYHINLSVWEMLVEFVKKVFKN